MLHTAAKGGYTLRKPSGVQHASGMEVGDGRICALPPQ